MDFHMVADNYLRPAENDLIFGIAGKAKERAKEVGDENIINSTIGALLDDEGKLVAFKTVFDTLKALDSKLISDYAGITGDEDFKEAVVKACFADKKPEGHIRAIATPGGSGAIKHAVTNFLGEGETVLTSNWYWAPYNTICTENRRVLDTYNLFNADNNFDFESFKGKVEEILERQKRIVVIINTPAHNPTGYSVSDSEWDEILAFAKEKAKNEEYKIIFFVDIAYLDFAGDNVRDFMPKFSNLPENILTLFGYSASKSYTMYGLRNGAIIILSSSEAIAEECFYSIAHSNRGTWSNGTKGAQQTLAKIYLDEELHKANEEERNIYRDLLSVRGNAFMSVAKEIGLPMTNYKGGFFVSIPSPDSKALCDKLIERDMFAVPLKFGLRVAICAITEEKCKKAPVLIKECMQELGQL